ncbi:MAG: N-acetylneuraminate synthase family protein [Sulfurimonas sp.]|uniref:N-acetylneuraminate synthase family protein n=1 Tax=Sulfurimonas sp. TaxID=2022749 RepID=UPI00261EEC6B|nr:N-acetylneuraminate synthase family protein [Sulfurimonas sp.]MDD3477241.1 N-acetylneuraminate synthase family protein [Sulfurimonas sp.]
MNHFKSKNDIYLIAEIGGNHEGDFEYAKKLTKLAAQSGADAVKFQIYTGDSLVNPKYDPDRNKHFKKFQLTQEQYVELAELCQELDITFMASVWDVDAFGYIDKYMPIYKVGSGDMTAYNLIKKMVHTGKPIILSSGLATFEEVKNVVSFIESIDSSYIAEKKLALLQCTSMYPIPFEDANLNVMMTYKENFDIPIGYSDHTTDMDAIEIAVAMGAEIIEVHFTDSREGKEFRDHKVSATKDEIQALIKKIKKIKTLQGSFEKKPTKSEIESGHTNSFRRGIYAKRELQAGETIQEEDLITLRPLVGIGADKFYDMVGKKISDNIEALESLKSKFEI